jgi:hypothetical protein
MKHEHETVYKRGSDKAMHGQTCSRIKQKAADIKMTNVNFVLLLFERRLVLCFIHLTSPKSLEIRYK